MNDSEDSGMERVVQDCEGGTQACSCGHRSDGLFGVIVTPTTGGSFEVKVSKSDTVESLKKVISKRLKVAKERICLLLRDRQLKDGTMKENGVTEGSRVTLLPSVETGLLTQKPEQSVMQALESLNDTQVNDFLSGKAPLNLTMRLGDHMMLIQLQLSAVAPGTATLHRKSRTAAAAPVEPPQVAAPAPVPTEEACSRVTESPCLETCSGCSECSGKKLLDSRALAEASRNLTQTLKQLSSEDSNRRKKQGAIIESMHHHGKGVYSGTFSGTLNPALQDKNGRPKRDISTIIHILNDLLCAAPQYRKAGESQKKSAEESGCSSSHQIPPSMQEDAQRLAEENQATRGKLEQLRMIMEERRARRRARREARVSPYSPASQWQHQAQATPLSATLNCDAAVSNDSESEAVASRMETTDSSDILEMTSEPLLV